MAGNVKFSVLVTTEKYVTKTVQSMVLFTKISVTQYVIHNFRP